MYPTLTSAVSLLFALSHLAPTVHAGNSRFYLSAQKCKGSDYVDFDIQDINHCYQLGGGRSAASLHSTIPSPANFVVGYKRSHENDCGTNECTIAPGGRCCSSKHKRLTGASWFQQVPLCQPLPECLASTQSVEKPAKENCTVIDDVAEPFIELADGSHFGLGVGTLGKLTAEEVQGALEANGKEQLSGERLAQLLELQVIKSE